MSAPRVIFVNRVFWPNEAATSQLLTDLADALAARGWEVHVIAAGPGDDHRGAVTIHRTGLEPSFRPLRYAAFLHRARRQLTTLVRPGDVVVLKTDPPMLAAAATKLAIARGARVVQWVQDIYPETLAAHLGAWSRPFLWPLVRARDAAWRRAVACHTLGEDMAAVLRAAGVSSDRVACLPNWAPVELHTPANAADIAAVRAAWGVGDAFVVAYSGNFGRVHDVETFLEAARALRDEPGVRFVLTGSGARWGEVRMFVQTHALKNVVLTPPQPRARLAASLAAAEAHLVTLRSGFESCVFPSKFAGIIAAARPVLFVGNATSELAQICRQENVGAVAAPGDSAALVATIRAWSDRGAAWQETGRRARALYERDYALPALADEWDRRLRAIVSAGESPLPATKPSS